jgi:hypothetical protein
MHIHRYTYTYSYKHTQITELFDANYGMFVLNKNTHTFWFNHNSLESTVEFELIGTLLGLAIYNDVLLGMRVSVCVCVCVCIRRSCHTFSHIHTHTHRPAFPACRVQKAPRHSLFPR